MTREETTRRRLVALMFTDMVGYSALAGRDERLAFELLEEHRAIFRRIFPAYGGRENKTVGDAFFIEFGSAVDAVECSIEIQTALYERNARAPKDLKLLVRIGLHLGDVIDFEGDSYGDGVNIAARVETQARPGGVYLTRQVYDQVAQQVNRPLRKVGSFKLKNIAKPTDIFRVEFAWERDDLRSWKTAIFYKAKAFFGNRPPQEALPLDPWKRGAAWAAFLATFLIAVGGGFSISHQMGLNSDAEMAARGTYMQGRAPASVQAAANVDLSQNWSFALGSEPAQAKWTPFDPKETWRYADQIVGSYILKNEFRAPQAFNHPAIVLGLVAGAHRVYLNGQFIGGSNHFQDLEYYTFDPRILRRDGFNTLWLLSATRKTVSPGFTALANLGAYLGEFDDINAKVRQHRLTNDVLKSVYLTMVLLVSSGCFIYFATSPRKMKYFYFGLFLLLGAMLVAYYNTLVSELFDYRFRRFLKLTALSLSTAVLFSSLMNLRGKRLFEVVNNLAVPFFTIGVLAVVWSTGEDPTRYVRHYDWILWFALSYTVAWVTEGVVSWCRRGWAEFRMNAERDPRRVEEAMVLLFGAVSGLLLFVSLKTAPHLLSRETRYVIQDLSISFPFLFALFVGAMGLRDYLRKTLAMDFAEGRSELVLHLVRIVSSSDDLASMTRAIQESFCSFLHARRSTIYFLDKGEDGREVLRVKAVYGAQGNAHVRVQTEMGTQDGMIGYVVATRAPLLVRDLRDDLRFREQFRKRSGTWTFKTPSCMVFPLLSAGVLIGVVTVADKKNGRPFDRHDFGLMHVVAKDLALLMHNDRLRNMVREFSAKTAA